MSFNLKSEESKSVNINKKETKLYQKPGIYDNVRISEVLFGKSTIKGTPYIRLKTLGQNGEEGASPFMYLSTTKSAGKQTAAWNITARNLQELVVATSNMSKADAEAIHLVPDNEPDINKQYEMLVENVSKLLVGKVFRAKFKGEQSKENGIIYATLDKVESMNIPREVTSLKFNAEYDIKLYNVQATSQPEDALSSTTNTSEEGNKLPF